jgi:hypothetical protein
MLRLTRIVKAQRRPLRLSNWRLRLAELPRRLRWKLQRLRRLLR